MMIMKIKEKIKDIFKKALVYILISAGLIVSFTVGYYFNYFKEIKQKPKVEKPIHIKRQDVTIGVDENSNLMIISNEDGSYTLMEDSLGLAIFNMYAKSIWIKTNE